MSGAEPDLERIRELRGRGLTPKQIARAVGLSPAQVTPLIRRIAATENIDPTQQPVAECWVSPGWSGGLTVTGPHDWPVEQTAEEEATGLVGVLVAREAGKERVSACAWLVDVYCLGVKNDLGPQVVYRSELPRVVHDFFAVFG